MAKPGQTGFRRLVSATHYSLHGIRSCWRSEAAFRQELLACLLLLPLGIYLGNSGAEKALLVAPCLLVLIVELLNSALEAVVDRIGPEQHDLSGLAKDLGSAAVMISLLLTFLVWVLVLFF